jgi:hypothetical protein
VHFTLFTALTSAPAAMSFFTSSTFPVLPAEWSGVLPDCGQRRGEDRGEENTTSHVSDCEHTPSVFEQCALVLLAQPLQTHGSAAARGGCTFTLACKHSTHTHPTTWLSVCLSLTISTLEHLSATGVRLVGGGPGGALRSSEDVSLLQLRAAMRVRAHPQGPTTATGVWV